MNTIGNGMVLSIPELVNIITAINMVVMFVILFFRKHNSYPNKILAFILLLPAINFINNYFVLSGTIYYFSSFIFINQISAFLCAPLICHYFLLLTGSRKNMSIVLHGITLIPILVCVFLWIRFSGLVAKEKIDVIKGIIQEIYPQYLVVLRGIFFVLLNSYFLLISFIVWNYSRKLLNIKSDYGQFKIRYLQKFIVLIWILNLIIVTAYIIIPNFYVDFIAVPLIINVFYFFLIRTSFSNNAIFTESDFKILESNNSQIEEINLANESKKELSKELIEEIDKKIKYLIKEEKIYTDSEINILKFSEAIDRPVHITSYFINTFLKTNFFNLINLNRIELAKSKMKLRGDKSEIEIIAYEVGFNSKSAFYRAFNKFVRQSPSDYISSL